MTLEELSQMKWQRAKRPHKVGSAVTGLFVSVAIGCTATMFAVPAVVGTSWGIYHAENQWESMASELPDVIVPDQIILTDKDGRPFGKVGYDRRVHVSLSDVNETFIKALIATEDRRFYQHKGIDPHGISRALAKHVSGGSEGASTITQQLVKNMLVVRAENNDGDVRAATAKSYERKLQEWKYALEIEKKMSKEEILEKYINIVYFSNKSYGVQSAAENYFGVSAKDLTLSQSALLVGMLKSPSKFDPFKNPDDSKGRRNVVLRLMLDQGDITRPEYEQAVSSDLGVSDHRPLTGCVNSDFPHFCDWVVSELKNNKVFGDTQEARDLSIRAGGFTVRTTLDRKVMESLGAVAENGLGKDNVYGVGLAVVQPGTGHVLGFSQNHTYSKTQVVYPTRNAFLAGSTFKAFTAAAWLGAGHTLDDTLYAPSSFNKPGYYLPRGGIGNAAGWDVGVMNLPTALARSSNTWFATAQDEVGVLEVAKLTKELGLPVDEEGQKKVTRKDASYTLGTLSVSPVGMAAAYATFAARGKFCAAQGVIAVEWKDGRKADAKGSCSQAITPSVANDVAKSLKGVVDGDDPHRTGARLSGVGDVGGKSGTTNRNAALWWVGGSTSYMVASWVGDPTGGERNPVSRIKLYGKTKYRVSGASVAGVLWKDAMSRINTGPTIPLVDESISESRFKGTAKELEGRFVTNEAKALIERAINE